jgi:ribulose-phosphate 3-epimerase
VLTVHPETCSNFPGTLDIVRSLKVSPGIAVSLDYPIDRVYEVLGTVDRVLLLATELGMKGTNLVPTVYGRIQDLVKRRESDGLRFEVYVDGGIRRETVPMIAKAGADGVIPGSLVFKDPDWVEAVRWVQTSPGAQDRVE